VEKGRENLIDGLTMVAMALLVSPSSWITPCAVQYGPHVTVCLFIHRTDITLPIDWTKSEHINESYAEKLLFNFSLKNKYTHDVNIQWRSEQFPPLPDGPSLSFYDSPLK
jgi:hypothetical protein